MKKYRVTLKNENVYEVVADNENDAQKRVIYGSIYKDIEIEEVSSMETFNCEEISE